MAVEEKTQRQRWGSRVRAVRRQKGMSQVQLAETLGVSASYLNLIESDKRPLPAGLLLLLATRVGVDLAHFTQDEDERLDKDLLEAFSDPLFEHSPLTNADLRELVASQPAVARAVRVLYDAYKGARENADALAKRVFDDDQHQGIGRSRSPSEEVNDFIQGRMNHFDELERSAEKLWDTAGLSTDDMFRGLAEHLERKHGVSVVMLRAGDARGVLRRYDRGAKKVYLSELLPTRSRSFQLAHQLGLLGAAEKIEALVEDPTLSSEESKSLARIALANYFAGAVLMPYEPFLQAVRDVRYDVEVVGRRFRVGFEQVSHRFATLRRPGHEGVPFHFLRIDVAGNISKRFSASGIHFARFSGACPRWNVFAAFLTPGMIRIQVSEMADGQTFFCIARTIQRDSAGWHDPQPVLAIGLGCKVEHARAMVYSDGVDLSNPDSIVPVGVTCRLCERGDCAQRAHPSLREPLRIDENVRRQSLYMPVLCEGR